MPTVGMAGVVLAVRSDGDGTAGWIVLLHGWPLERTIWSESLDPLVAAGYGVLSPDLPGLGESAPLAEDRWTVEAYADEVAALIRAHDSEAVALAGHSFGGYVALALAERHPDLLAGLGLVASRTIADTEAGRKGRLATIERVRSGGTRVLLPDLATKLLALSPPPVLLDRARLAIERARPDGVVAGLAAMAARPDRTAVLESFPGPVLVVHGREDQLIPEREAAQPKGPRTLVREVLPGVGHMPMWEDPAATARALLRWARASQEV